MTSYSGRHAELYDLFYGEKPYHSEAEFVHDCLGRYAGFPVRRLLELACGTGRHAIELAKIGYELVATDNSPDMLARARVATQGKGLSVRFELQDMRSLDLGSQQFDAAICLFDSIGYVETNDAVARVFGAVHRHLRDGALFLFEFWHAPAMLTAYEPVRVRRWQVPDGVVLRISETALDVPRQLARVAYSIYELHKDGTYSYLSETQTNRYFLVQEMAALLEGAGFTPLEWFDGFTSDTDIGLDTWHVVALARVGAGVHA